MLTGAVLGVGLGYLNWLHPAFDTVAHFRLHLAAGLILLGLLLLFSGERLSAVISLLVGAIGFWGAISGTPFSAQYTASIPDKPLYSMIHFNLYWRNEHKQDFLTRVRENDPQFLSFSETSHFWMPKLKALEKQWPHVAHCPEYGSHGGVMLFSKFPMDRSNDFCGLYGTFMKTAVVFPNNTVIELGSVHPRWPWPASGPRLYKSFVPALEKLGEDALITGDFNATTWSWALQRFAQKGNLSIVPGIGSTWLFRDLPTPLIRVFGLPIDNVMHKGRIRVLSVETLETSGSDHLPLLIQFQID